MPRGSKPGERRGGRKAGTANKRTREIADRAAAEGILPLDVMLSNMRRYFTAEQWAEAQDCAKDAAPYIHPRLANVEATGKDGGPLEIIIRKLADAPSSAA